MSILQLAHQREQRKEQGFTLIEVAVVLFIIITISAISAVAYQNYRKSNIDSSVQTDVKNAVVKIQTWKVSHPNGTPTDEVIAGTASESDTTLTIVPLEKGHYEIRGTNPRGKAVSTSPYVYNSIQDAL